MQPENELKNFEKSLEKQEIRIFSFLQKCDKLSTTSLQRQKEKDGEDEENTNV